MGQRGPAGKRSEDRIRRNADYTPVTKGEAGKRTAAPFVADEEWHPIALNLWESLENSGQSAFYEESDWAVAYFMCEAITRELKPQFIGMQTLPNEYELNDEGVSQLIRSGGNRPIQGKVPIKGASLSAFRAFMTALNMTEVDRRRAALELESGHVGEQGPTPGQAAVLQLAEKLSQKASGSAS